MLKQVFLVLLLAGAVATQKVGAGGTFTARDKKERAADVAVTHKVGLQLLKVHTSSLRISLLAPLPAGRRRPCRSAPPAPAPPR